MKMKAVVSTKPLSIRLIQSDLQAAAMLSECSLILNTSLLLLLSSSESLKKPN